MWVKALKSILMQKASCVWTISCFKSVIPFKSDVILKVKKRVTSHLNKWHQMCFSEYFYSVMMLDLPSTKVLCAKNCFGPLSILSTLVYNLQKLQITCLCLCWQNDLIRHVMKWDYSNSTTMWNDKRVLWTWSWMAT